MPGKMPNKMSEFMSDRMSEYGGIRRNICHGQDHWKKVI